MYMEHGGISFEMILEKKILKLNIIMMKNRKNFHGFCRAAQMDFQRLAGPRNVSVDLKYDVLCLWVFVYGIPAWFGRSNGLNFVLDVGLNED